jgi:hypothetical protein
MVENRNQAATFDKSCYINFQYLRSGLWVIHKIPFIAVCKSGFITVNMAENRDGQMTLSESFPCRTLRKCGQGMKV